MRTLTDTWTMTKRSLRHTTRSVDTIITVVLMPIGILLLFNYVFGGALGEQTGSIDYIDYITPAVIIMTVASGIAYAAVRLSTDLQKGIIRRFRTMPVASSSVRSGQALSSTLSNLFSCALVIMVAVLIGFRPSGDVTAWLAFGALLVLFTLATTWLAVFFGLLARTVEGAGAFSYILLLLIFISPSFVPTDSMTPVLRRVAEHQPMTPIMRPYAHCSPTAPRARTSWPPWPGPPASSSSSTCSRYASTAAAHPSKPPTSQAVRGSALPPAAAPAGPTAAACGDSP
jgi:ABC-2 type transport system permease protein